VGKKGLLPETGSLFLAAVPGRPATASLLPEIHVTVLQTGDIFEQFTQALALRKFCETSSLTIISGPTRTADIE
jgi:L-lactate utilization protein LutC